MFEKGIKGQMYLFTKSTDGCLYHFVLPFYVLTCRGLENANPKLY